MGLHCDLGEIAAHSLTHSPTTVDSRDASASKKQNTCPTVEVHCPVVLPIDWTSLMRQEEHKEIVENSLGHVGWGFSAFSAGDEPRRIQRCIYQNAPVTAEFLRHNTIIVAFSFWTVSIFQLCRNQNP